MKEIKVNIITKLTAEIKEMTIESIIEYLKNNEVVEISIKKVENNSTN